MVNIDELVEAFKRLDYGIYRELINARNDLEKFSKATDKHFLKFKAFLDSHGLGQLIDWTKPDGSMPE